MAKRYFEKQMEEGWSSVGEKYVCDKCLPDYAVAKFIRGNVESKKCSYCARRRPSAPMDDVLSFIAAGIHRRYEDPANSVGYCSAEGGYNIPPTDGYDLFEDVLEDAGDEVREDLRAAFADTQWVRHDPYGLLANQAMNHVWGAFSQLVMHGRRYSFRNVAASDDDRMDYGHAKPSDILDTIGAIVSEIGLITTLPPGSIIYRARQHTNSRFTTATEMGPPPPRLASQNRMSAAGVSRFYGGSTRRVARAETADMSREDMPFLSYAKFRTSKSLLLLDLTAIPTYISMFDAQKADWIDSVDFMWDFAQDIAKPVARDGSQHFEYAPTQIVAEYFEHEYRTESNRTLDGLVFNSSRVPGDKCYVLFADDIKFEQNPPLELLDIERTRLNFDQ